MTAEMTNVELNKDAYLALTIANNDHFEESVAEYIDILASEDDEDIDALRGVMTATLTHLAVQRKLDDFVEKNIPTQTAASVEYSLEVAENIGIQGFSTRPTIVVNPDTVDYKKLLELIVGN